MKEYPILFKGDLVRAILEGRKTQTRRIPDCRNAKWQVGDRLWVKETFIYLYHLDEHDQPIEKTGKCYYRADGYNPTPFNRFLNPRTGEFDIDRGDCPYWKPSLFMPRKHSRILLEITDIREEYLQDMTEVDAMMEGVITDEYYADNPGQDICNCPNCEGLRVHGAFGKNYGVIEVDCATCDTPVKRFKILWDTCATDGWKWADNPKIKRVEFKRVK